MYTLSAYARRKREDENWPRLYEVRYYNRFENALQDAITPNNDFKYFLSDLGFDDLGTMEHMEFMSVDNDGNADDLHISFSCGIQLVISMPCMSDDPGIPR